MKVLIDPLNTPDVWRLSGNSVKLRIYANQPFLTADGQWVPQGTPGGAQTFYLEVDCELTGSHVLLIPEIEIDSTVDALDNPSATYTAELVAGGKRVVFLANFAVNTLADGDPSTTWSEIVLLRNMFEPRVLDDSLSRQIAGMISSAVGQLNRANATRQGVTALTVDPDDPLVPLAVAANDPDYLNAIHGTGTTFVSGDYASLSVAVATIGATPGTLLIETVDFPSDGSCTVPATLVLDWGDVGTIQLTTGDVVVINSDVSRYPLRKIFDNAVAGQGTVRFTANGTITDVYPQWWGAVADRVGTAGTNNRLAVQAAVTALETAPGLGTLRCTGQFVIGNTDGTATQLLLVSKGITLAGGGGRGDGLYASIDTPTTVPMVRYKPLAHPDNEGFTIAKFTITSAGVTPNLAFPGAWDATNPSASHCLILDVTGGPLGATFAIRFFHVYDSTLIPNFAGGAAAGVYAIVAEGGASYIDGTPTQSMIGPNNLIYNGIFMPNAGDDIGIVDNTLGLYNDLRIFQVNGAGALRLTHNIIHVRKGVHIANATQPVITNNFIELNNADVVGTAVGSMLYLEGGGFASGGTIHGNLFNNAGPAPPIHAIVVGANNRSPDIDGNTFRVQAPKYAIRNEGSEVVVGRNTYIIGSPLDPLNNDLIEWKVYGFQDMPAPGIGFGINLSLVGNGRFIGKAGAAPSVTVDSRDGTTSEGFLMTELGALAGYLLQYGSAFGTVALRNAIQLFNLSANGKLSLGTNGIERFYIDANGVITAVGPLVQGEGAVLNIAINAIAPTNSIHHVGTVNVLKTITPPAGFVSGTVYLIPDAAWTYDNTGNIIGAGTAVVGRTMAATLSSSTGKWAMAY